MIDSNHLLNQFKSKAGQIAILIDPEKSNSEEVLLPLLKRIEFANIDYIFVGGSTVTRNEIQKTVYILKQNTTIPIIIFPGSSQQLCAEADGLLYLSLLSGRNPDFLIGHHITSAQEVASLPLEVIPTAYILIDGGTQSSVQNVSQTTPIPHHQTKIAVDTALAGRLQGKQLIYFDAGSGARLPVSAKIVSETIKSTGCPVIVGGGVRTFSDLSDLKNANVIVVGNKIEEDVEFLLSIKNFKEEITI